MIGQIMFSYLKSSACYILFYILWGYSSAEIKMKTHKT